MVGTAMSDQTMKKGLPMFDLGLKSPYLKGR
jgi:hypothetical protein